MFEDAGSIPRHAIGPNLPPQETRGRSQDTRSVRISLPKIGEGSGGVDVEEPLFAEPSRLGRVRVRLIQADQGDFFQIGPPVYFSPIGYLSLRSTASFIIAGAI